MNMQSPLITIESFTGEYRFLSNFYPSEVVYRGITFPTVEHAYQAAKSITPEVWKIFAHIETPGQVKKLGKLLTVRGDWEHIKYEVMYNLLNQKFENPELLEKLRATGNVPLIEGNHWGDTYWGMCKGVGTNHLGQILMGIRDFIPLSSV